MNWLTGKLRNIGLRKGNAASAEVPVDGEECWAGFAESQARSRLQDEELDRCLREDGYAIIRSFLNPADIERLSGLYREQPSPIHDLPFASSIRSTDASYKESVTAGIGSIFGPLISRHFHGYRYCFAGFLVKAPAGASDGTVPLHQDIAMVNEARYQGLGIWVPLVDVDENNGCLAVVPKSHRWSRRLRWPGSPFAFSTCEEDLARQAVLLPLAAGSAVVYCQKLVHTSGPNRSSAPRIVAGALAAPEEAPLFYYHRDAADGLLDVYAVEDGFYMSHTYGDRPAGVPRVARVRPAPEAS